MGKERGVGEAAGTLWAPGPCCQPCVPLSSSQGSCALLEGGICSFPVLPVMFLPCQGSSAGNGAQGTHSSVPAQGKGDENPPQSQGEGYNRDFCPEGMRCLSWSCGRAQAAPPCPSSLLDWALCPPLSACAGRSGAGICTLLAGQSQPLCSH